MIILNIFQCCNLNSFTLVFHSAFCLTPLCGFMLDSLWQVSGFSVYIQPDIIAFITESAEMHACYCILDQQQQDLQATFLSLPSHLLSSHTGCAIAVSHIHISVRNDASQACSRAETQCLSSFYCAPPLLIALLRMRVNAKVEKRM